MILRHLPVKDAGRARSGEDSWPGSCPSTRLLGKGFKTERWDGDTAWPAGTVAGIRGDWGLLGVLLGGRW